MKKRILFFLLVNLVCLNNIYSYAEEYNRFDIKYGMHERIVNRKYGEPILLEKIRVNPIPRKKALYKLDESNYMILYFFSGRINKIVLLEDMELDEATAVFKEK